MSGSFLADYNGYWQGENAYTQELSKYRLELNKFKHDGEYYSSLMLSVNRDLIYLGQKAKNQDLSVNLLYWMCWQMYIEDITGDYIYLHKFGMNSNPSFVFDRSYITGNVLGPLGRCDISPISQYDRANGVAIYNYNYNGFKNSSVCMKVVDPLTFGYSPAYDGDSFTVKIDVTSFAVAAGVRASYYT